MRKIKQGFDLVDVCGEKVIVAQGLDNIDFSKIISLNETAAFLWEKASEAPFDERILAEYLVQEYEVSTEQALEDAQELITTWETIGIIEEV